MFLLVYGNTLLAEDHRSHNNDTERHRIEVGFKIAPVPLHFNHKNWELVGLGSYILNAQGGCNDCHTNPLMRMGETRIWTNPRRSMPRTTWLAA